MTTARLNNHDTFLINQTGPRPRDASEYLFSSYVQRYIVQLPESVLTTVAPKTLKTFTQTMYIRNGGLIIPPFLDTVYEFYNGETLIATGKTSTETFDGKGIITFELYEPILWQGTGIVYPFDSAPLYNYNFETGTIIGSSEDIVITPNAPA